MNNQEFFTASVQHLRRQKARAVLVTVVVSSHPSSTLCAYRTPEGNKCAVGAVIPDDEYNPAMEGANGVSVKDQYKVSTLQDVQNELIYEMQGLHDNVEPTEWEEHYPDVAKKFGLEVPPHEQT